MLKHDELADPNSCLNKANDEDFIFVLIQKDIAMADTIRFWCSKRIVMGKNKHDDPKIKEAMALADKLDEIHKVQPGSFKQPVV